MSAFRRTAEQEIYQGAVITLGVGTFVGPDGEPFERDVVHHPGAVSVVPLIDDEFVLVRQYRAALDHDLLEIPAGKRDVPGEPPEETAHRELVEEVGYRAGRLIKLAEFYNSPGFSDEHSHTFLGLDLTAVEASAQGIEEVGYRAGRLIKLAEFYNSPGFSDEHSHTFLGLDLTAVAASAQGIEEEHMTIERVPVDDVPAMIASGELIDAKTIIGLTLALRHLGR